MFAIEIGLSLFLKYKRKSPLRNNSFISLHFKFPLLGYYNSYDIITKQYYKEISDNK